jgi:hypothetical protein
LRVVAEDVVVVVVVEDVAVGKVVAPVREEVIENAAATTTTAMSAARGSPADAGRMARGPCAPRTARDGRTRVVAEVAVEVAEDTVTVRSVLAGGSLIVTAGTLEDMRPKRELVLAAVTGERTSTLHSSRKLWRV